MYRPGFAVSLIPITGPISEEIIGRLAKISDMSTIEIQRKISQQDNPLEPVRIKSDVGTEIIAKIGEYRNDLGAHIFGYVSEISDDKLGKGRLRDIKLEILLANSDWKRFMIKWSEVYMVVVR